MVDLIARTYDPKFVTVTFGPVIISGFAEGTFVNVARNGDLFEKSRGADGSVDRVNKNARDGRVTVTLKQTSRTNDQLSLIAEQDLLSNTGKYPLTITDKLGTTFVFAAQAWIAKDPDPDLADSLSNREWIFDTGLMEKFIGGNVL
jgi:hypothetical protein